MDFRVVLQCPPLCSLSSHAAAICPILIIIHKHDKTGFPLSFIYSVVIQIHYLLIQINSSRPSAPLTYLGRHSYSWPNSLNKISRHYNAAAITTRQSSPLSRLNYISQQHVSFFLRDRRTPRELSRYVRFDPALCLAHSQLHRSVYKAGQRRKEDGWVVAARDCK